MEPKTKQVTNEGKDKDGKPVKVTYKRSELSSPTARRTRLTRVSSTITTRLFPLKAYWDSSPAVIDAGMYNLPEGTGESELVGEVSRGRRQIHAR
jgi:hypothetical protein